MFKPADYAAHRIPACTQCCVRASLTVCVPQTALVLHALEPAAEAQGVEDLHWR
jgi:hypothetical protein